MEIIEINRTSDNHKYHRGNIMVTYDEAVMIANALNILKNRYAEVDKRYGELYGKWKVFTEVLCHGQTFNHPESEEKK